MNQEIHIILTEDNSPTAFFEGYEGEKMHHSGGAFGESVYIFGPALQWGFSKIEKPKVISLGTGLGYNEILTAAFSLLFEQDYQMWSYEKDKNLNSYLKNWVLSEKKYHDPSEQINSIFLKPIAIKTSQLIEELGSQPHPMKNTDVEMNELMNIYHGTSEKVIIKMSHNPDFVYDIILQKTSELFDIPAETIKNLLRKKLQEGSWEIHKEFPEVPNVNQTFHIVLYDFFSSKAMAHFWSEEFLNSFLENCTEKNSVFGTYACTGNLKRALKNQSFQYTQRVGYLWKRNSSFAIRLQDY